jgi:hypothetical protein
MARYAGLTDDPERRKKEHGNPTDWRQRSFSTESEARDWEKDMLSRATAATSAVPVGVTAALSPRANRLPGRPGPSKAATQ